MGLTEATASIGMLTPSLFERLDVQSQGLLVKSTHLSMSKRMKMSRGSDGSKKNFTLKELQEVFPNIESKKD